MLSCIDTSLDTVLGSMEDVISAAEMLGAVHQVSPQRPRDAPGWDAFVS